MVEIQSIIAFVQAHWLDISNVIVSVIGIASIIVRLTPTQKDDAILGKIIAFVGKYIALNPTPKA